MTNNTNVPGSAALPSCRRSDMGREANTVFHEGTLYNKLTLYATDNRAKLRAIVQETLAALQELSSERLDPLIKRRRYYWRVVGVERVHQQLGREFKGEHTSRTATQGTGQERQEAKTKMRGIRFGGCKACDAAVCPG